MQWHGDVENWTNRKFAPAIMYFEVQEGHHMWKIGSSSAKHLLEQNFQIPTPSKVWVSGFQSVNGNGKFASAIMKKIVLEQNFHLTNPPPSLGFWFSNHQQKQNIGVSHYEKLKKLATIL